MANVPQNPMVVLGAGSWGTALALLLARNGNPVRLWGNDPEHLALLREQRFNEQYLPGFYLPNNIHICDDFESCVKGQRDILVVVPSHAFRSVLERLKPLAPDDVRIAWGSKGLDPTTNQLLHQLVADIFSDDTPAAVLAGPSFAKEVAEAMPTAVSLSGNDEVFLESLIDRFHNDRFRVYINSDFMGVELCGALKNILAIAVGISDGLGLGANSRSALITRGLAEMSRLCIAMGGEQKTLMSLAGVGDLVLTCTDDQSRNRRFGLAIGQGATKDVALKKIGQAVEGLSNVKQVYELAQSLQVDMPITEQVFCVLNRGYSPEDVLAELLERAPKFE